jgi:hypothetical protein
MSYSLAFSPEFHNFPYSYITDHFIIHINMNAMKRVLFIMSVLALVTAACHHTHETAAVDTEAEKAAVSNLLDQLNSAVASKDVAAMTSNFDENALICGTDPSEFWNKQQIKEIWTQMLAESVPEFQHIGERKIIIAPDGHSAVTVEQYMIPTFSEKIPWRRVFYLLKTGDKWMIHFSSVSFIPENEDIPKLNEALQ